MGPFTVALKVAHGSWAPPNDIYVYEIKPEYNCLFQELRQKITGLMLR